MNINSLPHCIKLKIMGYLNKNDTAHFAQTCRQNLRYRPSIIILNRRYKALNHAIQLFDDYADYRGGNFCYFCRTLKGRVFTCNECKFDKCENCKSSKNQLCVICANEANCYKCSAKTSAKCNCCMKMVCKKCCTKKLRMRICKDCF